MDTDQHAEAPEAPDPDTTTEIVNIDGFAFRLATRDGLRYLLSEPFRDRDHCDDCDVAALLVTPSRIQQWLQEMDLARELRQRHGVEAIVFRDFDGPSYYEGDYDNAMEAGEDPLPLWAEETRIDCPERNVGPEELWWTAQHHYCESVQISTEWLTRTGLGTLGRYLEARQ